MVHKKKLSVDGISSRSISMKLVGVKSSTANAIENLKLQHADELARAHEEHAMKVSLLESEIQQCRSEIETLVALSDERSDTLMPLPSPSKTLKFVKNTSTRKSRKGGMGMGGMNGKMIAELKAKHQMELGKATELYVKRVKALQKEVEKYKNAADANAMKKSSFDNKGSKNSTTAQDGINRNTGVAENEKENNAGRNSSAIQQNQKQSTTTHKLSKKEEKNESRNTNKTSCQNTNETLHEEESSFNLKAQYESFFQEDYKLEKDPTYEAALAIGDDVWKRSNTEEIDELCKDLNGFMSEIKIKYLTQV